LFGSRSIYSKRHVGWVTGRALKATNIPKVLIRKSKKIRSEIRYLTEVRVLLKCVLSDVGV